MATSSQGYPTRREASEQYTIREGNLMGVKMCILILSIVDGIIIFFSAKEWEFVGILNFLVAFLIL